VSRNIWQRREAWPSGRQSGFTLIETVVALVVLAVGAGVVLQHLRGLILRAEKEQEQVITAMTLLNEATRLPHWPKGQLQVVSTREGSGLYAQRLTMTWPSQPNSPSVDVRNFSFTNEPLPPLDLAYTPGQRFVLERGRFTMSRLAPSLDPPANTSSDVNVDTAQTILRQDKERRKEAMQEAERTAEKAEKAEREAAQQASAQKQGTPENSPAPAKGSAAP